MEPFHFNPTVGGFLRVGTRLTKQHQLLLGRQHEHWPAVSPYVSHWHYWPLIFYVADDSHISLTSQTRLATIEHNQCWSHPSHGSQPIIALSNWASHENTNNAEVTPPMIPNQLLPSQTELAMRTQAMLKSPLSWFPTNYCPLKLG